MRRFKPRSPQHQADNVWIAMYTTKIPFPNPLRRKIMFGACGTFVVLSGCASWPPLPPVVTELRWNPLNDTTRKTGKPILAVVLSSGSFRAYAHIGVMRAFEKAGLQPDLIVGTSAGAIVGSLWASGMRSQTVEAVASELGTNAFASWTSTIGQFARGSFKGLASGVEIEHFIVRHVRAQQIEDLPIRLAVVATDLNSGETIAINGGSVAKAVRASAGVPVRMTPVEVVVQGQARELVDGGLVEPLPVNTARQLGGDIIVGVDVGYRPSEARIWNPLGVAFQSLQIAINSLRNTQRASADFIVAPRIHERDVSRSNMGLLIAEGERATSEIVPALIAKISTGFAVEPSPPAR